MEDVDYSVYDFKIPVVLSFCGDEFEYHSLSLPFIWTQFVKNLPAHCVSKGASQAHTSHIIQVVQTAFATFAAGSRRASLHLGGCHVEGGSFRRKLKEHQAGNLAYCGEQNSPV